MNVRGYLRVRIVSQPVKRPSHSTGWSRRAALGGVEKTNFLDPPQNELPLRYHPKYNVVLTQTELPWLRKEPSYLTL